MFKYLRNSLNFSNFEENLKLFEVMKKTDI